MPPLSLGKRPHSEKLSYGVRCGSAYRVTDLFGGAVTFGIMSASCPQYQEMKG
jgi:hypothetical protein